MYNFIQLKIDFCLVSQIDSFLRPVYQRSLKMTLSFTHTLKKRIFINIFWVVEIRWYCWEKALCLPFLAHLRGLDFVLRPFCSSSTHFRWQSHPFWCSKLLSYTSLKSIQPMLSLYICISTY